ncbi:formyltetrahydrofolate-dependent phosphoribosylglycinamide formyltransferase [Halanaerobium congolense]|jgi:phosphoribosylglycinamide formyltransferase-1|uniref:Phosphoribosylglycinamide formyltransferase n=1 Tax=Halanaerobium congolense TaxID=54121 RepID=A0A1H9ZYS7_9FIRM|nr:phosphoribosylglycinamide formyltransferase [Halanaerobium congolense]KXS49043.1 MAG: phosphoribosylglycinamide formyltransferase 1 [Halanaerobium sp. T82-1]PTX16147.1 formyltetrahydrofolate-dependent phosphoribosylglycinamide formyltransferase [Halanaerobium congolense]TDP25949.1 formyltetrahydrofolate-dependent phosphoribosylglycinamide formyltransferase [Halanaerobium congolense]SDF28463.1 formyltetrahydrofolate-dependent phosphoribosylglycinamide formyltransferase [Halanaerobium congolen
MLKIAVFASGRGSNFQSIIDNIKNGKIPAEVKLLISDNQDAGVLKRAESENIEHLFIDPAHFETKADYEEELIGLLKNAGVELVVLAGYMRILSPLFVRHFKNKIINIHPSLLPAFKGLNAQKQAVKYGVKYSGCTVHFVDQGMDTGPIIKQAVVEIKEEDNADDLAARILKKEHKIYPEAVKLIAEGRIKIEGRKVKIIKEEK